MAKTLTNLRSNTRTYLDESAAADWTSAEVDLEINAGYQEVITSVMEVYENFYVTTDNWNSVADQVEYGTTDGVPSDIFKIRRLELNYDVDNSNSIAKRCKPISMDAMQRDLQGTNLGMIINRNPAYYVYGLQSSGGIKIGIIPKPDKSDTDAFQIWYVPVVADLSSATDEINIPYPDRYFKLISLYAAAQLLRKGQQEEAVASRYLLEFEMGIEKMKQQLEDFISDDSKYIIDTEGM